MASDGDQQGTDNAEVTFSLVDATLPFSIDQNSGLLSTRQERPDLMGQQYNVQVVATDAGTIPRSSTGTIIVDVAPPNSYAPVFSFPASANILENARPLAAFYSFDVTDRDSGREGDVEVTLLQGPYSQDFSLTNVAQPSGGIRVDLTYIGTGFDREQTSNFTLEFQAEDQGNSLFRKRTNGSVTFQVTDVNDSPPTFIGAPYSVMISEGAAVGATVTTVVAEDADEVGTVEYSSDFSGGDFGIDRSTGAITVMGPLRVSREDYYQFPVTVSDGVQMDTTYVNITVTEVNDNVPMFVPPLPPSITVPEDTPEGTTVLNVTVTDADTGISGAITLTLLQEGNGGLFAVDSYSTNEYYIYTERALDFEVSFNIFCLKYNSPFNSIYLQSLRCSYNKVCTGGKKIFKVYLKAR